MVIDHKFINVIDELFLIVFLTKPNPVHFVILTLPEVAYQRITLLLLLNNIQQLLLPFPHLQTPASDLYSYIRFAVLPALSSETHVKKAVHCNHKIAALFHQLLVFSCRHHLC